MLPQFEMALERRLGVEMAKYLNEDSAGEFTKLIETEATPEQLLTFWQKNIPDFENKVKTAVLEFIAELKK